LPFLIEIAGILRSERFGLMSWPWDSCGEGSEKSVSTVISYPHIVKAPDFPARLERLPRIRVAQIVADYLFQGWSPDEICNQYPHLLPAEVHWAMAYYFDHSGEIEKEIQEDAELADRWRSRTPPSLLQLRAKGLLRWTWEGSNACSMANLIRQSGTTPGPGENSSPASGEPGRTQES
jgi:hypothetical protein